jgi:DNA-binding response OmpR family regulator
MLREPLQRSGYRLDLVASTQELLASDQSRSAMLLLVDQRVPDWDMLRTDCRWKQVPILVVVPQGAVYSDSDLIMDLERGADGIHRSEDGARLLLARIGAYLRRSGSTGAQRGTLRVGAVELDADKREVTIGGERVALSAKPFAILEALMRAPAKVFTRTELIDLVWGPNFAIGAHTLDVHVHAIRQHLERVPRSRCRLVTIKGVGFALKPLLPVAVTAAAPAARLSRPELAVRSRLAREWPLASRMAAKGTRGRPSAGPRPRVAGGLPVFGRVPGIEVVA